MKRTREELMEELDNSEPAVSLKIYKVSTGDEDTGAIALKVDFGKDGPPESVEDADLAQTIGALLSIKFTELMEQMQGDEVIGDDEGVLSSLVTKQQESSQVKDEIDKQLEDMGLPPTTNKEVH